MGGTNKENDKTVKKNHNHNINYLPAIFSGFLLAAGLLMDYNDINYFSGIQRFLYYVVAYIPVAYGVLRDAVFNILNADFFTEFFLMSIATIGAFAIGEYPEAVAVMLFYTIGELFQHNAVAGATQNIQSLIDMRPDYAYANVNGEVQKTKPESLDIGAVIRVRKGEKVPLDGVLLNHSSSFNTAALTGESKPRTIESGGDVLAGMINKGEVVQIKVTKAYEDSALSRILHMVREATARKGKTEKFIRKFAGIYTPVVTFLAIAVVILPWFWVSDYVFSDWLYRALVFLVISCPCGLVISIPLAYFGGIGAASNNGILFKGGNFIDLIAKLQSVVMDKTGTLTEGKFAVRKVHSEHYSQSEILTYAAALEQQSTHPIAEAIQEKAAINVLPKAVNVNEIKGHGIKGIVEGKTVLLGNDKMLKKYNISIEYPDIETAYTIIYVAIDNQYAGYILIADELKADVETAISQLQSLGVKHLAVLSGDRSAVVKEVATSLNISNYHGDLLPEGKVKHLSEYKQTVSPLAFIGDGINDAPVLATADIGIAMGALGSDVAIETADIVIQTDQISKVPLALKISRFARTVLWENLAFAFLVKIAILILGVMGIASMWEAVFADVGVALIAILNAMRIQWKYN